MSGFDHIFHINCIIIKLCVSDLRDQKTVIFNLIIRQVHSHRNDAGAAGGDERAVFVHGDILLACPNCLPSRINVCYDLDRLGTRSAINFHIGNVYVYRYGNLVTFDYFKIVEQL